MPRTNAPRALDHQIYRRRSKLRRGASSSPSHHIYHYSSVYRVCSCGLRNLSKTDASCELAVSRRVCEAALSSHDSSRHSRISCSVLASYTSFPSARIKVVRNDYRRIFRGRIDFWSCRTQRRSDIRRRQGFRAEKDSLLYIFGL